MARPVLNVKFTDGVYGVVNHGPLVQALERSFELRESNDPQLVLYGEGKAREYRQFPDAVRVYVAAENLYPHFGECDYALTFLHLDDPRHLRVPLYVFDSDPPALIREPGYADRVLAESREFCSFVVSNGTRRTQRRIQFFHALNAARRVSSGGRVLNNVGGPVPDKLAFLRRHKFNLCFENHAWPGYTTEKLGHALACGCVPIYWGNPDIAHEFNPACFINVADFPDDAAAIAHILRVDDHPEFRRRYLEAPCFAGNRLNRYFDLERLARFLHRAVTTPRRPRSGGGWRSAVFKLQRKLGPAWAGRLGQPLAEGA
jgi:hypothetical protein